MPIKYAFMSFIQGLRRSNVAGRISYPAGPKGEVFYAIGDIHGRLDCLLEAQMRIDADRQALELPRHKEIYLGDIIDRGPHSAGVVENIRRRSQTHNAMLIRGNHEWMFEAYMDGNLPFERWKSFGGAETLLTYGIEEKILLEGGERLLAQAQARVPTDHLDFLRRSVNFARCGDYCFIHAGLRPNIPLELQSVDDLLWIREGFLDHNEDFGFIVVHGHTPNLEPQLCRNRINIDTGAYITNRLTVIRLDDGGVTVLANASLPNSDISADHSSARKP